MPNRRLRLAIVRMTVLAMPEDSILRKIAILYMRGYADWEIRDELNLTKKVLSEARGQIRQTLIDAGLLGGDSPKQ